MAIVQVSTPGPQGPSGLNWRQAWSATATYAQGDGVSYNGASYTALSASVNVVPGTAPMQWSLLVQAPAMAGSTGSAAGSSGSVPAPDADDQGCFLRGDGTWAAGAVSGLTYNGSGQLTGYTEDGIAYALAYNGDGTLNTITGGGSVGTVAYSNGAVTGISYT
ncbi:YD repeat-containing protein [Paraburkholderia sp. WC7.3g]|uniref:carbohydrate-binding protein n=1 Tax=Paraburkholderia sp. WC7.3g TaxID=2991070 RepID=UPI003D23733A